MVLAALRADGGKGPSGFRADDTPHPSGRGRSAAKEEMGIWLLHFSALPPQFSGNRCKFSRLQDMPGSSWGQGEEKEPDGAWRLANENGSKEDGGRGRGIGKGLIVFI